MLVRRWGQVRDSREWTRAPRGKTRTRLSTPWLCSDRQRTYWQHGERTHSQVGQLLRGTQQTIWNGIRWEFGAWCPTSLTTQSHTSSVIDGRPRVTQVWGSSAPSHLPHSQLSLTLPVSLISPFLLSISSSNNSAELMRIIVVIVCSLDTSTYNLHHLPQHIL